MKLAFARILAAAALLGAGPVLAQQAAAPQALVVTATNRTATAAAQAGHSRADAGARPGDVVRYRLTFTNTAGRPVRRVQLSNPLAGGMQFVAGSVNASRTDALAEYSVDGGRTFSAQPMEEVLVEGRRVRRPAPPERFTNVRWVVDGFVAPGATVVAEFDARIGGAPRPAAQTPGAARR
jgi:uncharacterized repeat protein (TIGR01451 family)